MNNKLTYIIVLALGLLIAVFLGTMIPNSSIEVIAGILATIFAILCYALKGKVWMLIPITTVLLGSLRVVPGSFTPWVIMVFAVIAFLALRAILGVKELDFRMSGFEWCLLLQFLILGQAYARNPTGFAIFGSASIGGRDYIIYAIAIMGSFVLGSVRATLPDIKKVVIFMAMLGFIDCIIVIASTVFPSAGWVVQLIYSHSVVGVDDASSSVTGQTLAGGRFYYLRDYGVLGLLFCAALWRPITCLNPLMLHRFGLVLFSLGMAMLSGFRAALVLGGSYLFLGTLVRKKTMDVFIAGALGIALLSVVAVSGVTDKLPISIQRTISFIPGIEVSGQASHSAEGSGNWRFEMWELALTTDKYIKNKLLGDGFGLSAVEHRLAMDEAMGLSAYGGYHGIEYYMAKGSYHGFHVEAIRFTGVVGLLIATVILAFYARKAWQLCIYFRGRPEWWAVVFFTIPMMMHVWFYWLVIGYYKGEHGYTAVLLLGGVLKMLDNIKRREHREEGSSELEIAPAQLT